jgi:hypothetical protein
MPAQQVYVSESNTGRAEDVDILPGMTAGQLFSARNPKGAVADYTIAINDVEVSPETVLTADDVVTLTPSNIAGAH